MKERVSTPTSDNPENVMLRLFRRNVSSPSKIPVRKADENAARYRSQEPINRKPVQKSNAKSKLAQNSKANQRKPLWNSNNKTTGLLRRSPAQLPKVSKCSSSNLTRSQASVKLNSHFGDTNEGVDNLSQSCKDVYEKLAGVQVKLVLRCTQFFYS